MRSGCSASPGSRRDRNGFSCGVGDGRLEDQIDVFKIFNVYEHTDRNILISVKTDRRTRGHEVTLAKEQCRIYINIYHFPQRTTNKWN